MKYYYQLYGQTIESELSLPEANQLLHKPNNINATITYGNPPTWVLERIENGDLDYLTSNIMWFYLPGLVLYYVESGSSITIWRESDKISELALRSYLLGSALALLLMQKSIVTVHGSALSYKNKGIIISGPSGSGKSTTALALQENGFDFLSDDISPLQQIYSAYHILPGPPWQKVCKDIYLNAVDQSTYQYIDEDRDKYGHKLQSSYIDIPTIATAQFIITPETSDCVQVDKLTGVAKLHWFTHNLYRGEVLQRISSPAWMQLFLNIIQQIDIYHISRPKNKDSKQEIINLITDISNNYVSFVE